MGVARRAPLAPAEARKRRAVDSSESVERRSRGPQLTWQQGCARTALQGFEKKRTQALKPHALLNSMFRGARVAANQRGALGCSAIATSALRNLLRFHGKPSLCTTRRCPRARALYLRGRRAAINRASCALAGASAAQDVGVAYPQGPCLAQCACHGRLLFLFLKPYNLTQAQSVDSRSGGSSEKTGLSVIRHRRPAQMWRCP